MTSTRTILTVLVVFALAVPGLIDSGFAAAIPDYFQDEWVGFVCLTAFPQGSPPTRVLLQLNFDKTALGGIPLSRADRLFGFLTGNIGLLSPTIGSNPQSTCSFTPNQILVDFPRATALQAAQQVSPTFQQLGFARYIILDAFLSLTVIYSGPENTLRTEVFLVTGNNDLSYVATNEIAESLVP